jgi:hypothetical protein
MHCGGTGTLPAVRGLLHCWIFSAIWRLRRLPRRCAITAPSPGHGRDNEQSEKGGQDQDQ